jgi:hypothetical protein
MCAIEERLGTLYITGSAVLFLGGAMLAYRILGKRATVSFSAAALFVSSMASAQQVVSDLIILHTVIASICVTWELLHERLVAGKMQEVVEFVARAHMAELHTAPDRLALAVSGIRGDAYHIVCAIIIPVGLLLFYAAAVIVLY